MGICCVYGCFNRSDRKRKKGVSFHRFPKDELLKKRWIEAVRRPNWQPNPSTFLCSEHFEDKFLNRTFASGITELRENAVPTIFPSNPTKRKSRKPPPTRRSTTELQPIACARKEPVGVFKVSPKEVSVQGHQKSIIPNQICNKCYDIIDKFFKFKQNCIKNIATFNEFVLKLSQGYYESQNNLPVAVSGIINKNNAENNYQFINYRIELGKVDVNCQISASENQTDETNSLQQIIETERQESTYRKELKSEPVDTYSYNSVTENQNDLEQNIEKEKQEISYIELGSEKVNVGYYGSVTANQIEKTDIFEENFESCNLQIKSEIVDTECYDSAIENQNDETGNRSDPVIEEVFIKSEREMEDFQPMEDIDEELFINEFSGNDMQNNLEKNVISQEQSNLTTTYLMTENQAQHIPENNIISNVTNNTTDPLSTANNLEIRKHDLKKHVCGICQKVFKRAAHLKVHSRTHTGFKPHKCNICQKSYNYPSDLSNHQRIHTENIRYECKICNKDYQTKIGLHYHMSVHTGQNQFQCDVCFKSFSRSHRLKVHKRIHSDDKPHSCEVCHKKFNFISHLKRHKLVHSGQRPYECAICQKNFIYPDRLTRHKLTHK